MGCECPDDIPRPRGSCIYFIYSGGPFQRLNQLVAEAVSEHMEQSYGRPVVHDDGSLEFPGESPKLSGYRRDGSCLYPAWPPCTLRILKVQVVEGVLTIMGICGRPNVEHFSLEVCLDQCQECSARQPP
jgi:hypothetical protein